MYVLSIDIEYVSLIHKVPYEVFMHLGVNDFE